MGKCISIFSTIVICLSLYANLQAQTRSAQMIMSQGIKDIGHYDLASSNLKSFVIKMDYGASNIAKQLSNFSVLGATIYSIDLVYTDFPKGQDLSKLNLSRIQEMERFYPLLVQNPLIKWNILRQTDCNSEHEARGLFHGIVIYYLQSMSTTNLSSASNKLENYLPEKINPLQAKKILDTMSKPTVIKVFDRHPQWKNAVLIIDLTSSMIPYNSQVALWQMLHGNCNMISEIVMFNDGNSAPRNVKKVGSTGGIYHGINMSYENLRKMSIMVCESGLGNDDFPENDLEAVLFAINKNPNAAQYILVADNDAPPRDMALLRFIHKPIRVVMCGAENGILPEYLEIARKTGGSVHTISKDIDDLIKKREGEVFTIGFQRFKISAGHVQVF